ncbi:hypothetical protein [Metallibacterium scheffleri]|uniref:PIN domain-containing protein n=1 Tax=Metallibacterium scheffleri TaxID=993689 RepID=A0A4S3KNW4_9GAMM|nr:hypothetical protein [Metallibacterium scheffleri]THD10665.1 hypothetical protein B1806_07350 [Metallibacterium scheffleri]
MSMAVIDTNILLVANGSHADVSDACRAACIERLQTQQHSGVTVIDDGFRILSEYRNKTSPNQPKGVGDAFLKWLLQNQANASRVHKVAITETATNEFAEFPDATLQSRFDAPDRKFAAVAHAHTDKPPIWQAADCKWLDWWPALAAKGVRVEFVCPDDARRFYTKKFPKHAVPDLPLA